MNDLLTFIAESGRLDAVLAAKLPDRSRSFLQKLISSIIIIALMLCPLSAIAENWYITQGENLVGRLCELASDETYATLFTGADDVLEQVRLFAQTDFSEIEEARIFYLPDSEASFSLLSLNCFTAGLTFSGKLSGPR